MKANHQDEEVDDQAEDEEEGGWTDREGFQGEMGTIKEQWKRGGGYVPVK